MEPSLLPPAKPGWLTMVLERVVLLAAAGYSLLFIGLAGLRLGYPFELEWIEGAAVDALRRILAGHSLYGPPDIHFVPLVYNPVYFYVSAALMKVIGVGFVAPRLISIISGLGSLLLLMLIVRLETPSGVAGGLAAGFYAASFHVTGAWLDLAKPDSLFLFLALAAFYVQRRSVSWRGLVVSGALYVLAFYTKQNALPIILITLAATLVASAGQSWPQAITIASLGLLLFVGLNLSSQGWYAFYTLDMLTYHERAAGLWLFWAGFLPRLWPALLISALYLVISLRAGAWHSTQRSAFIQNTSFSLALILTSWSVFLQRWTFDNGFMPACLGVALLSGLGYARVQAWASRAADHWRHLGLSTLALSLLQFGGLAYDPARQLPTAQDRAAGERFVALVAGLPGEVLIAEHGYYGALAGKPTYLHASAYADAAGLGALPPRTEDNRLRREQVTQVFELAKAYQVFDWVILDEPGASWLPYYFYQRPILNEPGVLNPVTGHQVRPESVLIKNPVAWGGEFPLHDPAYAFLLTEGWGAVEDWGRWTVGQRAEVQIALSQGSPYRLVIKAFPACDSPPTPLSVTVGWNQATLGEARLTDCADREIMVNLPDQEIVGGLNTFWFQFASLASATESPAPAPAIGIKALIFVRQQ